MCVLNFLTNHNYIMKIIWLRWTLMNDNLYNNSFGINGTCTAVKNESRSRKSSLYHIIIFTTAGINII